MTSSDRISARGRAGRLRYLLEMYRTLKSNYLGDWNILQNLGIKSEFRHSEILIINFHFVFEISEEKF